MDIIRVQPIWDVSGIRDLECFADVCNQEPGFACIVEDSHMMLAENKWGDFGFHFLVFYVLGWCSDRCVKAIALIPLLCFSTLFSVAVSPAASAQQPEKPNPGIEHVAYFYCDDFGKLFVNGKLVLERGSKGDGQKKLVLRRGDVITAVVVDKKKDGAFGFLLLLDNRVVAEARDFKYSIATDPDWQKTDDLFGWKSPLMQLIKTPLGNEARPQGGWAQGADRKFERVCWKYVMR